MSGRTKLSYDSFKGQCILLVLVALGELGGRGTKREVFGHITWRHYFEVETEDRLPFPTALRPEPRWELLMGLAWRACVEGGCIVEEEADTWQLTPGGADFYKEAAGRFRKGTFDAHRCFLWTEEFKRCLVPAFVRRASERHRPAGFYHNLQRHLTEVAPG